MDLINLKLDASKVTNAQFKAIQALLATLPEGTEVTIKVSTTEPESTKPASRQAAASKAKDPNRERGFTCTASEHAEKCPRTWKAPVSRTADFEANRLMSGACFRAGMTSTATKALEALDAKTTKVNGAPASTPAPTPQPEPNPEPLPDLSDKEAIRRRFARTSDNLLAVIANEDSEEGMAARREFARRVAEDGSKSIGGW